MGLYLSEPVRDKTSSSYRDYSGVQAAACTQQGWRTSQEDAHLHVRLDQRTQLFAVFDGHGGPEVRDPPLGGQLGAVRGRMSSLSHTLSESRPVTHRSRCTSLPTCHVSFAPRLRTTVSLAPR